VVVAQQQQVTTMPPGPSLATKSVVQQNIQEATSGPASDKVRIAGGERSKATLDMLPAGLQEQRELHNQSIPGQNNQDPAQLRK